MFVATVVPAVFFVAHARAFLRGVGQRDAVALAEEALHRLVPDLGGARYKGQSGRVAVVGGSVDYTGAPYYAAIAALKAGVDLSHVFCDEKAATAIKAYSPELIVHPVLRSSTANGSVAECASDAAAGVVKWLHALDAIVVGPGLGRDPALAQAAADVLRAAASAGLPTVVDADALQVVADDPSVLHGADACFVLTPNRAELARLCRALLPGAADDALAGDTNAMAAQAARLAAALGPGVAIVAKGACDVIHAGSTSIVVEEAASPKRSGGQGDVLAGLLAAFLAWARRAPPEALPDGLAAGKLPAAYGACMLARRCSLKAYRTHKRSMTAPDVIDSIGAVIEEWHPAPMA